MIFKIKGDIINPTEIKTQKIGLIKAISEKNNSLIQTDSKYPTETVKLKSKVK